MSVFLFLMDYIHQAASLPLRKQSWIEIDDVRFDLTVFISMTFLRLCLRGALPHVLFEGGGARFVGIRGFVGEAL